MIDLHLYLFILHSFHCLKNNLKNYYFLLFLLFFKSSMAFSYLLFLMDVQNVLRNNYFINDCLLKR